MGIPISIILIIINIYIIKFFFFLIEDIIYNMLFNFYELEYNKNPIKNGEFIDLSNNTMIQQKIIFLKKTVYLVDFI